jgi:hypothetical protein
LLHLSSAATYGRKKKIVSWQAQEIPDRPVAVRMLQAILAPASAPAIGNCERFVTVFNTSVENRVEKARL